MDKMLAACLVFGLLWFPGVLDAQEAGQPCPAPRLDNGYFLPQQRRFSHQELIIYTCQKGHKTVLDGKLATSTCLDGKWSDKPQCINENNCSPPAIPNGKYKEDDNGWYEEGEVIWVSCDPGYQHQNRVATAKCINRTWSSVPVCVRRWDSCSRPPQIPHAVIIGELYRDLFEVNSSVEYECEDRYAFDGQAGLKTIFCISGNWTEVPKCIPNCGRPPVVPNGVVMEMTQSYLRYQCVRYFKLEGNDQVYCLASSLWSQVPVCRPNYCFLNTAAIDQVEDSGTFYLEVGQSKKLKCRNLGQWYTDHYTTASCSPALTFTLCCSRLFPWSC